jgi:hypothetical protein
VKTASEATAVQIVHFRGAGHGTSSTSARHVAWAGDDQQDLLNQLPRWFGAAVG